MSLCILTTSTALFPPSSASYGHYLRTMPLTINQDGLVLPAGTDFHQAFSQLEREFSAILVLAPSSAIFPGAEIAASIAHTHGGSAKISVIDTRQIGPGLGILAQMAARKAVSGANLGEVELYIRALIPYLFTIFSSDQICFSSELKGSTAAPPSNEPSSPMSVYSLEDGHFLPFKKVRTTRHLLETFQEFLEEFETPQSLAYFHGKSANLHTRLLRELAAGNFPGIPFSELDLNPTLSALFGDHTYGLTVLEIPPSFKK